MSPELYWIAAPTPGRLAIMPRPRGGDWLEDEVRIWQSAGVDIVVSLLTGPEISDLELTAEKAVCEAHGMEFVAFPIEDRAIPASIKAVFNLAGTLATHLAHGKNIAIHCRQGLGRAPLMAICVLILLGLDAESATQAVSSARDCPVPETREQEQWIARFARDAHALVSK